jgi:hypothetical protein
MRKPSEGEQAWFLEEESEPRNKRIFLAGENEDSLSKARVVTMNRIDKFLCLG